MKILKAFLLFILFISCRSYSPYSSNSNRKQNLKTIKSYLKINIAEIDFLQKNDSISFDIGKSINKKVKPKLINRRLDSLISDAYSKEVFLVISRFDREFPNKEPIEYDKNVNRNSLKAKNIDEAIKLIKNMDSIIAANVRMKAKDTIIKKKNKP